MIRRSILALVAAAMLAPPAAADDTAQALSDQFTVHDGEARMIVAGAPGNMQVVWVSDPTAEIVTYDGTPLTALWAGELTETQKNDSQ